jgi:predicted SnoaL-like aldol condensation-catalyzing enzyme
LLLLPYPLAAQAPESSIEANKAVVHRYIENVLSAGKLEEIDQLVAEGYVDSTPGAAAGARGPEVVRASQRRLRERFDNVRYTLDQLVAEGDLVVARYIVFATLKPDGQTPGAGRSAEIAGMTIFRLEAGKIRETWILNDQLAMYRQLGYRLEPPGQSAPPP